MSEEVKNTNLTEAIISELERKVLTNTAKPDEYETIDSFLMALGAIEPPVLNALNSRNIFSYEEFVSERKKPLSEDTLHVNGYLVGFIAGNLRALRDYVKENQS